MNLYSAIRNRLAKIEELLLALNPDSYTKNVEALGLSSIGQHVRHILEMFLCLENQYAANVVNYDLRARDLKLETEIEFALSRIVYIKHTMEKTNKKLQLQAVVSENDTLIFETNYERELLNHLEHCIHHEALIAIALKSLGINPPSKDFGFSPSTIHYQQNTISS